MAGQAAAAARGGGASRAATAGLVLAGERGPPPVGRGTRPAQRLPRSAGHRPWAPRAGPGRSRAPRI